VSNNYTIKLTVTSKDGCVSTGSNVLNASAVHNQPKSNYSVNPLDHATPRVCIGTPIFFKDSSGGNTAKSYWIWGDNGLALDSAKIINHIYAAGSYAGEHFITDNFGCRSDTIGFLAMIDTFPVVNDGIKYILAGTSDILKPDVSGGNTYLWNVIVPFGSTKTYLDLNDIETPICTPIIDSIVYKVDVTGDGVCPAKSLYYTVRTFTQPLIPNVFSPNGDGINDYWDISSLKYFTAANVQVFNRYGQVVLSRLGYSRPWDGNDMNGKPLPVGTYYYVIQLGYGFEPRSGSITILR
jgi:gliding motility-associated-like protein